MNEYPYGSDMGHGSTNMTGFFVGALVGAGLALLLRRLVQQQLRLPDAEEASHFRCDLSDGQLLVDDAQLAILRCGG